MSSPGTLAVATGTARATARILSRMRLDRASSRRSNDAVAHFQQDAPTCPNCGHVAVRNGACYKCFNCGDSLGCS